MLTLYLLYLNCRILERLEKNCAVEREQAFPSLLRINDFRAMRVSPEDKENKDMTEK